MTRHARVATILFGFIMLVGIDMGDETLIKAGAIMVLLSALASAVLDDE